MLQIYFVVVVVQKEVMLRGPLVLPETIKPNQPINVKKLYYFDQVPNTSSQHKFLTIVNIVYFFQHIKQSGVTGCYSETLSIKP